VSALTHHCLLKMPPPVLWRRNLPHTWILGCTWWL
jgi:hypothetical protein